MDNIEQIQNKMNQNNIDNSNNKINDNIYSNAINNPFFINPFINQNYLNLLNNGNPYITQTNNPFLNPINFTLSTNAPLFPNINCNAFKKRDVEDLKDINEPENPKKIKLIEKKIK